MKKPTKRAVSVTQAKSRFRVGVRWPEWTNGYIYRIFEGLSDYQRQFPGFQLCFQQPSGGDLAAVTIDHRWDGDGLIVFRYTKKEAAAWAARGVAVVNLSMESPEQPACFPQVTMDNVAAGRIAGEHLATLGLKDFAFIHEPLRKYSIARRQGFREAVEKVGNFHEVVLPVSSWPEELRPHRLAAEMAKGMQDLPRPCGVYAKDDILAVAALRALRELGIRCPDDMPLVGTGDDVVFCHSNDPALSSIKYPGREIGKEAAILLRRMMTGEHVPQGTHVVVLPTLSTRESTGRVVLSDAVITTAMDLIRGAPLMQPIRVGELAHKTGVSRELLRQRFHAVLGVSPRHEIERVRMEQLRQALRNPRLPMATIAENHGFGGNDELSRFVKRVSGMTPGQIRKALMGKS